jgi:hypothetical protein
MYYFIVEARPVDPPEEDEPGARVRCWIEFKDLGGARLLAEHYIRAEGWEPVRFLDEVRVVVAADYADDAEWTACHDDAVRDGLCLVFDPLDAVPPSASDAGESAAAAPPAGNPAP